MLLIDKDGWVVDKKVEIMRRPLLQHGTMPTVSGIIVHQTGASTAGSTLNSYLAAGANGAHFLIDKDGTIYQTGSVFWRQYHVGKIKARCLLEKTCTPIEAKALAKMGTTAMNTHEMAKAVPDRFPSNSDSIGIELVGAALGTTGTAPYETVTAAQYASLHWLVGQLEENFHVPTTEVFRHPVVSRKDDNEAATAQW